MVLMTVSANAETVVPCLICTGNSSTKQSIDLSKFNRITFDDEGFTVSSSQDGNSTDVRLLYSLYSHLEIGDDTPTNEAGIDDNIFSTDSKLNYLSDTKCLTIVSPSTNQFSIGVFNINGVLIATSKVYSDDSLSVEMLPSDTYIAVATDGNIKLTLKFIIH